MRGMIRRRSEGPSEGIRRIRRGGPEEEPSSDAELRPTLLRSPPNLWYNYVMKFGEIVERLGGTVVVENKDGEITSAYTSDLLSDVMGHCGDESVLITIQNHLNAIAVCTLAGIEGIVLCHDRQPPEDMVEAARREGIGIMTTSLSQFEVSVKLAYLAPSTR